MKNAEIIQETDTLVLARPHDDMHALGVISLISTLAASYGKEQMYAFIDRMRCAIEMQSYGIIYERVGPDAEIEQPVGYITWGMFSRATEVVFTERLRPLQSRDFKSGSKLWVVDLVAPLGHGPEGLKLFDAQFEEYESYNATRWRGGKLGKTNHTNSVAHKNKLKHKADK